MDPFAELADEAAAAEAAGERARTRWMRQQAAEEATLAGTLLELADSGTELALRSRSGRTYRGRVGVIGDDFVEIGDTWVRLAAVVSLRHGAGATVERGSHAGTHRTRFGEALATLAPERPSVVVVPVTGEPMRGTLVAVGVDVLTLTLDADGRAAPCVVALDAVAELTVLG